MTDQADREFGALLRKARDDAGLTSQQLAEQLFVARESVDRYLRGERRPHEDVVAELERICGLPTGELLVARRSLPARSRRPPAGHADGKSGVEASGDEATSALDDPTRRGSARTRQSAGVLAVVLLLLGLGGAAYILGSAQRGVRPQTARLHAYAEQLNAITTPLAVTRLDARRRLRRAGTPAGRAAAAARLGEAFARAVIAHRALPAPAALRTDNRKLHDGLTRARDGYRAAARAARDQRVSDFRAASRRIERAERTIDSVLARLRTVTA